MAMRKFPSEEVAYCKLLKDENRDFLIEGLKPSGYQNLPPQHAYQPIYYELPNIVENQDVSSTAKYQSLDSSSMNNIITTNHNNNQIDNKEPQNLHLKRKSSESYSELEDENVEDNKSIIQTGDVNKKQNHSEIEKRRRDKMNTYIVELSSLVPMCHALSRKLDKLTVLRMAVQHLKSIRGCVQSFTEGNYKPSFLSDQELKNMIVQAADGFLFVVGCDRGRILFVSESVNKFLNYSQGDLLGQSVFDILHPKDVGKVKEQLSSSDLIPRERLIDAKTMLPVKTDIPQGISKLSTGARRSFFCRMKYKVSGQVKEEADTTTGCHKLKNKHNADKKFNVIHCTGYLKPWVPARIGLEDETESENCNLSCLVAVGRILPHISTIATAQNQTTSNVKPIQFISRHAIDGQFLFVDQRTTLVLGYLPQELLGTSMYEYYHHDDINFITDCHKAVLQSTSWVTTKIYRFKTKDGSYLKLQSEWRSFKNPWTKEVESLISKNNLIWTDFRIVDSSACEMEDVSEDFAIIGAGKEMQRIVNKHVEVSKIGRQIADSQRIDHFSVDSPDSNENEASLVNTETYITTSTTSKSTTQHVTHQTQENLFVSHEDGHHNDILSNIVVETPNMIRPEPINCSSVSSNDGNDETAMAVLMSLLEADTGLGGHVDFSGLSWPLSSLD